MARTEDSERIDPFGAVATSSAAVQHIIEHARHVAPTPYSVLIEGETGTGKEVFARAIHATSQRIGGFVPINCSAVPQNMFEAELFGAKRGAYTGLEVDRIGLFRVAHKGTLFLDEVADMPPATQAKLLRVLDDRVIRPLGSTEFLTVDVRVIAATHRPLATMVEEGAFRQDLFYRLSETQLTLPPLRKRAEDLPAFIRHALATACTLQNISPPLQLDRAAAAMLHGHSWPGNIRELNNAIATAVLSATGTTIGVPDLPARCRERRRDERKRAKIRFDLPFFDALVEFEHAYLADVLRRSGENITEAARISGLSRGTVRNKARSYGLLQGSVRTPRTRSRVRLPAPVANADET